MKFTILFPILLGVFLLAVDYGYIKGKSALVMIAATVIIHPILMYLMRITFPGISIEAEVLWAIAILLVIIFLYFLFVFRYEGTHKTVEWKARMWTIFVIPLAIMFFCWLCLMMEAFMFAPMPFCEIIHEPGEELYVIWFNQVMTDNQASIVIIFGGMTLIVLTKLEWMLFNYLKHKRQQQRQFEGIQDYTHLN